ncbi:rhamnogalacturonan acetylesterase [Sphingobacterium sp. SGR-19]|uniref:rhamnogalacturonan acetylesterase n=1 Tax=Sphingobacterium sp. SGR-19 TaxID=2710886 RepID=UPI0013EB56C6|nr:rhamnogalacturonan acetylesterase [Sphingobacterium sp. SGR-19]NGM64583.1 rhamnogalacturonan acetylesterase [Sphingobacterium sp. SGR-19]
MIKFYNIVISLVWPFCVSTLSAQILQYEFSFGKAFSDRSVILKTAEPYEANGQYGFEFGSEENVEIREGSHILFSNKPFYFSVNVPEGNYKVSIGYQGLSDSEFNSTVRSESRRLQLEQVNVPRHKEVQRSFIVNRKDARIREGEYVRLKKPRELEKLDWDDKLTLEFQHTNNIRYIRVEQVQEVPTIFLAGNSTVVNQEHEPWASWGQMIPRFFDTQMTVANHAESGLALSSFLTSKRLDKILTIAKPGDYLFIEFGHNDQKEKDEKEGAYRGYTERLRYFVEAFRAIGGTPVIVTSTARRSFNANGQLQYTLADYPNAARKVAQELQVPLIDLNKMTRTFYETLGVEGSKQAFVHYAANTFPEQPESLQDNTHFNTYGAYQIAKMVLQGIIDNRLDIRKHIIDFKSYKSTKPDAHEDWEWPLSVKNSDRKPDGN